jgi:hypothetical protein
MPQAEAKILYMHHVLGEIKLSCIMNGIIQMISTARQLGKLVG